MKKNHKMNILSDLVYSFIVWKSHNVTNLRKIKFTVISLHVACNIAGAGSSRLDVGRWWTNVSGCYCKT